MKTIRLTDDKPDAWVELGDYIGQEVMIEHLDGTVTVGILQSVSEDGLDLVVTTGRSKDGEPYDRANNRR